MCFDVIESDGHAVVLVVIPSVGGDGFCDADLTQEFRSDRLMGVEDLMSRGLTHNINNGLGTTILQYDDASDVEDAEISMDGVTEGKNDIQEFVTRSLPLPIIHKDFNINIRKLTASRALGESVDTSMAEISGRKVAERIEDILFNGAGTLNFGGGTLPGYTTESNRNTVSFTSAWDASAATGETILDDVLSAKQASLDDQHFGPWILYVPTNYETVLDEDFKADSDKTTRERILGVSGILDVKVADKLTASNVVLAQMTSDVVRIVNGLEITTVEWQTLGGMRAHFKVMAILIPQIRSDQESKSGVVHLS